LDYKLDAGSYDGFELWTKAHAIGRYFKSKFTIGAAVPIVHEFNTWLDDNTKIESASNVSVISAGQTITFPNRFHNAPVSITVQPLGATPLLPTIDNITAIDFDVRLYDTGGTAQAGNINWQAEGI
jgi:hypothetical protein